MIYTTTCFNLEYFVEEPMDLTYREYHKWFWLGNIQGGLALVWYNFYQLSGYDTVPVSLDEGRGENAQISDIPGMSCSWIPQLIFQIKASDCIQYYKNSGKRQNSVYVFECCQLQENQEMFKSYEIVL